MTVSYTKEQRKTAKRKSLGLATVSWDGKEFGSGASTLQGPFTKEETKAVERFAYDLMQGNFRAVE